MEQLGGRPCLRKSIGAVLRDCKYLVVRFFAFYYNCSRTESAFLYRNRWDSTDACELRSLMRERYGLSADYRALINGNDFELAKRQDSYFPGRPQLRPLPFNDEEVTESSFK